MKSMTGYGRAKQELHGRTITAELRAVNHRYLDCTVKAPRQYGFLDDAVKKAAAARIARGKVEVYIGVETQEGGDIAVTVNHAVAEHYLAALHELADRYGLRDDVSVMSLAKLPDVLGSVQSWRRMCETARPRSSAWSVRWRSARRSACASTARSCLPA